jgi:peptidoglycan/LPS O-acetylase OafA/YrhL
MSVQKTRWVNGIDSLRFVLALIVLLSHLHDPYVAVLKARHSVVFYAAGVAVNHLFCGVAAVMAFFIISGFVIHYPNRGRPSIDVMPFLVRRWVRVGLPMTVVAIVAAHYHLFGVLPLWSLYCELFYYTLYPLLFSSRIWWQVQLYVAYAIAVIFTLLYIADAHHLLVPQGIFFQGIRWYLGIAILSLPAWLLGVVLAARIDQLMAVVTTRQILVWRVLVFGLSTIFIALKMQLHINYDYSMIWFALLLYKWLQQEILYYRSHAAPAWLEYMGRFSYSMYLCHMLWFSLLAHFFADNVYTFWVYILISIGLSWLVYLLLEYPAHRAAQKVSRLLAAKEHATSEQT